MKNLFRKLNPFRRKNLKDSNRSIYSIEDIHKIIDREIARADRNSHEVSFVFFEITDSHWGRSDINKFANMLAQRKRMTDELGWYDDKRICIILPDTSYENAKKLADSLCRSSGELTEYLHFKIVSYPSERFPDMMSMSIK